MNVCTKEYGFSLQVSFLKWEIRSFFIQGIDQKSSQNLSKNPPEIEVWRPLEASWRRPGPSWASWASWLAAYRVPAGHLGGLGGLLGSS